MTEGRMSDAWQGAGPQVTAQELDRERVITYLDWAEAEVPAWWLPTYAALITLWLASHDLGGWWPTGASAVFVVAMVVMLRLLTRSTRVSMPRFRGMPAALKRTYLIPGAAVVLAVAGYVALTATMDDVPYSLFGLVVGPVLALSLAWQVRRCRIEAARIAAEEGIAR